MNIKVVTYNLMSGFNNDIPQVRDYDKTIDVLREFDADIIGLEELGRHATRGYEESDIKSVISYYAAKLDMYGYFARSIYVRDDIRNPYGNGILSKYPIKYAKTVPIPDPPKTEEGYYESRSVLVAELDVAGGITVLVSHFGLMKGELINAVETVKGLIESINGPILFMGDLNLTPDSPVLKPIFEILNDTASGKCEPITWPSDYDRSERHSVSVDGDDKARKIDYIFASDHFKLKDCYVKRTLASDHLPYIAELEI